MNFLPEFLNSYKTIRLANKFLYMTRIFSFLPLLVILFFSLIITFHLNSDIAWTAKNILPFFVFCTLSMVYAHMLNSYTDYNEDRIAKKNTSFLIRREEYLYGAILSGLLGLLTSLLLIKSPKDYLIVACLYLIAIFYSFKPVRFKERGILAFIVVPLSLGVLEYFLILDKYTLSTTLIAIWLFILLFLLHMKHQIRDFYNDIKTNTKTYVTKLGMESSRVLFKLLIIIFLMYNLCIATFYPEFIEICLLLLPASLFLKDIKKLLAL